MDVRATEQGRHQYSRRLILLMKPGSLELLHDIPKTYKVCALSNTSALHWERMAAMGLDAGFTRTYLSYQTGHLKPAPDAFHSALRDMGLVPSEVLFFDDLPDNVRAARELGIDGHLALGPYDVRERLQAYGIIQCGV